MSDLVAIKKAARTAAFAQRADLHAAHPGAARQAAGHALTLIAGLRGVRIVSAYLPIRSEIDPRPAMRALLGLGFGVCVPVVEGLGLPLRFRAWTPQTVLVRGPFDVDVPATGDWLEPDVLLVPLLAFDAAGWRLGYGGGFYDRTLADLRERQQATAIGFAYAGQEAPAVPHGDNDVRLDRVVTETGARPPA